MNAPRKPLFFLLLVLTLGLAVAAAGCGGDDEEAAPPPAEPAAPPGEEPPSGEGMLVTLVTDTAGPNDKGFNEFTINGLEQAGEDFGIETRVLISETDQDYLPNLQAAAEAGSDLVIATGFLLGQATHQAAEAFPDTRFMIIDVSYGGDGCEETDTCELPNVVGTGFYSEEPGYVAGVMAALMSESGVLSTVGGIKLPTVDNWIAGFQQGAKDTNPDVTLLNAYSQDFVDQAKCKEIALDHIGQGADVVFQVAGQCGLGALDAAAESGVWGIGVDADQSGLGDHILTSGLKPVDQASYQVIKSVVDGTFMGGTTLVFELTEPGQSLGTISPEVPQEVIDAANEAEAKILSGEIDPPATLPE